MKVLIISDDRVVKRDVHFCLKVRWPDVVVISIKEVQKGVEMVEIEEPDLVLVDSNPSAIDTTDVISKIREFSNVPLMILTKKQSEMEEVRCLEAGADDWIEKPFSPIELLTKIIALLRRTWGLDFKFKEEKPFCIGDRLTINASNREVLVSGKPVKLTPIEYRVLLELVKNHGRIVSHEMLLERVWGADYVSDTGFVKRYVYRLRQKLESDSNQPLIISERGIGYKLVRSN